MSNGMALFKRVGLVFLSGKKVRDLYPMKHYSPKSITDFNAEEVYEHFLTVVA
jgi:hypothetical protein